MNVVQHYLSIYICPVKYEELPLWMGDVHTRSRMFTMRWSEAHALSRYTQRCVHV